MTRTSRTSVRSNQHGLVAIFSVLIIMGILTLLTIGFTNITRLSQRRALDDALKSQAFYAAETGVNSAVTAIRNNTITSTNTGCRDLDSSIDFDIDPTRGIALSCLLVMPTPPNYEYDNVPVAGQGEPIIDRLEPVDGTTIINRLRFEWDSTNGSANNVGNGAPIAPNSDPSLFTDTAWGSDVGMVRVDILPVTVSSGSKAAQVAESFVLYLYPTDNAAVAPGTLFNAADGHNWHGATVFTHCNTPGTYRCNKVVALNPSASAYYIRIYAYYNPVQMRVTAMTSTNTQIPLKNGQAVIDATGQANDVYRRIQVRVPISPDVGEGLHEVFSLFSGDSICKRYIGTPTNTVVSRPSGVTDPSCNIQ